MKKHTSYILIMLSILLVCSGIWLLYHRIYDKTSEVEHELRYATIVAGEKRESMNILQRMDHYKAPAVSLAIINDGKVAWAKGYGSISFDNQDKKVGTHTLFQAGSISKPVTALGALLLVQQGKLSLDEDVNNYLKSWKIPESEFTKTEKVTLRRLLSHSAGTSVPGFNGYSVLDHIPTTVEILDGKKPLVNSDPVRVTQTPGKEHRYSGGGTTIVQLLIEDVTGEKFDAWMHKNILIPFGMVSSTFNQPLSKEYSEHAAWGHDPMGKQICGKWHIYPEMAAAGLWTTPTDLAHFLVTTLNILHGKQSGPLNQKLMKEAITQQACSSARTNKVGLGFFLNDSEHNMIFGHDGQDDGFIATMQVCPELGKGWVIMINNDGAGGLFPEIKRSIADAYKVPGFEPIIKDTIKIDPASYNKFTGIYKNNESSITINMRDNTLFALHSFMSNEMKLYPATETIFFMKEVDFSLQFIGLQDHIDSIVILDKDGKKLLDENKKEIVLKKILEKK